MSEENKMHLTVEYLEDVVLKAKALRKSNTGMSNVVQFVKTAWRQDVNEPDQVEHSLLPECTPNVIIEG